MSSSFSTITGSALDVTSDRAMVRLRRVGVRLPRACDSEICSWRRGDSDDSREGGCSNWCKSAFEAEFVGFGALVDGSVLSAETEEEVAAVVFVATRVAGCGATSSLVDDCFATDSRWARVFCTALTRARLTWLGRLLRRRDGRG